MAKRHSPREASFPPMSTAADSEEDGLADTTLNPSKRLKTAGGSAAASASPSAAAHERDTTADGHRPANTAPSSAAASVIKKEHDGETTVMDVDADTAAHGGSLLETMSSISEDSDGDVPYARGHIIGLDADDGFDRQVTQCAWDGCQASDQQTMDKLVEHLHAEHVEGKQRRYTCEWIGCSRKGKSHASAYALKAHLRSHTREKPYVCHLPECDQAFARADALGKHIRSSHDIDLMRSIDPPRPQVALPGKHGAGYSITTTTAVSSNGTGGKGGSSKLKIIIKTPQSHATGQDDSVDYGGQQQQDQGFTFVNEGSETTELAHSQGLSTRELEMPLEKLHGLCRCQLGWAEAEGEALRKECAAWEAQYHQAWLECQVLLDQVIQSEKDWHERRKAVLASLAAEERLSGSKTAATAAAAAEHGHAHDSDSDSAADDYDHDDDDDGGDADVTVDGYSFADASSFSVGGSQLRHEVSVD